MITGIQSALSGLQAFTTEIENNAKNVGNLYTTGFKKGRVVLSARVPQGVKATVEQVGAPGPVIAEQTNQGMEMIEQSNVDLGEELSSMMLVVHGYKANLKTLQVADQMLQSVLDIKA